MGDSGERSVVSALKRDHRHIEALLARLRAATVVAERRRLLAEVTTAILRHTDAEDKYLYGVLPRGTTGVEDQIAAHARIRAVLGRMRRTGAGREEFARLTGELDAEVRRNIVDEESSVLAWLTQWVDERTLVEIGDEIEALRS